MDTARLLVNCCCTPKLAWMLYGQRIPCCTKTNEAGETHRGFVLLWRYGNGETQPAKSVQSVEYGCCMLMTCVNAPVSRTANGWKFCDSIHSLPEMVSKNNPAPPWKTVRPPPKTS